MQKTYSKEAIHQYWQKRVNDDNGDFLKLVGDYTFETIYETSANCCYACGKECRVHKAHIIPDSLGGTSQPDNLFLLCIPCHQANPDTVYPEMFFNYVKYVPHHLDTSVMSMKTIIDRLYKEATEDEKQKFNKVYKDPTVDPKELWKSGNMSDVGTGLNNAMSLQTASVYMWKTITNKP